ncbi:transmembrane amino acid transporter protein-domain-containing protein [Coemansia spiralis]|nr:transmembrane amino acid transporter protein-domain-containing protein [Coemansia spiralis]
MPGGFRRQFVHDRAVRAGRRPVTMMTENFVDFIGLYGHFAGGEYPSDDDDDDDDDDDVYVRGRAAHEVPADVCTPLLRHRSTISSRSIHATASSKKAFFLLLKAFVGTGVLVLPKAFSNGGLLASAIIMFFVAWYAWHCMVILGEVYLRVGGSYSELGHKLFGRWASRIITVSILFAQIGFCSAYTIFVATNVRDLWNSLTGCQYNFSPTFWVLAQLLAYIPLSWVRKIKQFAPFALAANIFIMLGLGYVLFYDVFSISAHGIADIVQYNPLRFPLLVGTAVFAYEGVTLVIPILDSMTHQEQFSKVLTIALGLCIVIFVGVGTLSYMAFGESVETVILLNLPKGPPTILVQLFYSLAIMLSVPLQLFPAVRILESGIFPRSGKGNPVIKWQKNMFRALMAMVVASVAIFGAEQLDNFIAIIGAFSCTPLSFIFPAALHYQISSGHRWTRFKDIVLAAVGTVILVYVTYIGIRSWGAAPPPIDRCAAKP